MFREKCEMFCKADQLSASPANISDELTLYTPQCSGELSYVALQLIRIDWRRGGVEGRGMDNG